MSPFLSVTLIAALLGAAPSSGPQDEAAAWAALERATQSHDVPEAGRLRRAPRPDYERQLRELRSALTMARDTRAEPIAMFHIANTLFFLDRFAEAREVLVDLKTRFPRHGLVTIVDRTPGLADSERLSMVDACIRDCDDEIRIRAVYEVIDLPEARLDPTRRAVFHTSLGDFSIGFFTEACPATVANFEKLAREGYYNDIYVHQVLGLRQITLGCPNTKLGGETVDRADDGSGSPGYNLDIELSTASHVAGSVAMRLAPGTGQVNGGQFMVCLTDMPELDDRQTVFGQIIDGLEVVRRISQQVADDRNNPYERVVVSSVELQRVTPDGDR